MRNSHDIADRQLIAAVREYKALCRERYTIVKLDEPIQRGWRRFYVLGERAAWRKDRTTLEAILEIINTVVVSWRRDFISHRTRRRKRPIEIEQSLRAVPVSEWNKKGYPEEWLRYFRYEVFQRWFREWQPYWVFTQPSLFEFKIERNWLWYFREVDPAIESRLSELDRWLESRHGWQRYERLKGYQKSRFFWQSQSERQRELARQHRRQIAQAFAIFPEVELTAPWRCRQFSFRPVVIRFSPA
jgi:hypothetical protein